MLDEPEALSAEPFEIPRGYDPNLYRLRHSAAHVLAQAVTELLSPLGPVRLAIGPPITDGFYYDFELPRALSPEDLSRLEAAMKDIIKHNVPFHTREVTPEEARELFADQPYKLELIDDLTGEGSRADGVDGRPVRLTVVEQDGFRDLCRGFHVQRTGDIPADAFRLLDIAGAYWRGQETRPMLQRVYGTAWFSADDLRDFLARREAAEQRDHRRLNRDLELYYMDPLAPGMPYWLPNGLALVNELVAMWREVQFTRGYQEIATPLLNDKRLWEISGHWDFYKDNMFIVPVSEHTTYALKPMNCPNAMVVFNTKTRSYKDLPVRFSHTDLLHRHERSGTLHGLLRVQKIQQDDAHIFISEDQIEDEYNNVLDIVHRLYSVFDLNYSYRIGTRPDKYIGDLETWDRAEAALVRILDNRVGREEYYINAGDGAFYGPKIDILLEDTLGRSWQMGTIQLDFQQPRRFNCSYIDSGGAKRTPVVVHRAIYGALERFIGILIEHTAGALPAWCAPVQARVASVTDEAAEYAAQVTQQLRRAGFRAELDASSERIGAKVRLAAKQKVAYLLVVGKAEMAAGKVAVRARGGHDLGAMPIGAFQSMLGEIVRDRRNEP